MNSDPLSEWKPRMRNGNWQHRLQHGDQVPLVDGLHAPHHLPLGHRVHRVDVVHPRLAVEVALVHRVHPQVPRTPLRIRPPPLGDVHLPAPGALHRHPQVLVSRRPAQVVDVRHRDLAQPRVGRVALHLVGAAEQVLHRGARQGLVRLVGPRQQLHVGRRVAAGEHRVARLLALHPALAHPLSHQPRRLRAAQPGGLAQEPPHSPLVRLGQLPVLVHRQDLFHVGVGVLLRSGLEFHFPAALHELFHFHQA